MHSIIEGLFLGKIENLNALKYPRITQDDKEMLREILQTMGKFVTENLDARKCDEESSYPLELISKLAELGFFALNIPEEFGGLNLSHTLYTRVMSETAYHDGALCALLGAHQSIGLKALLLVGTPEQKERWLPRLATGEMIAAFALTEPGAGSDAFSILTSAKENQDGSFTLNGQKLWITNGGLASFYTVFAKTTHDENGVSKEKITCFVVEKGMAGLSFGEKEDKLGIRASETRAVFLDNVVVPKENILGEMGRGFKIALTVLNSGRLTLSAGCLGAMRKLLELSLAHATERVQFGKSISEFEMIQKKLALLNLQIYQTESIIYLTSGLMAKGLSNPCLEAASCKVFASEALCTSADIAMQIAAGVGYMKEYPFERIFRDSKINQIFEGTNEILRCLISLTGCKGPGDELKKLTQVKDLSSALESLGVLSKMVTKRAHKLVGTKVLKGQHPIVAREAKHFSQSMHRFALLIESQLQKYGRKIIEKELHHERIANMSIDLYLMLAMVLRMSAELRDEELSKQDQEGQIELFKIAFKMRKKHFDEQLKGITRNDDKHLVSISKRLVENNGYHKDAAFL